ncbi:MAG: 1-acyl-sn-glycerol-3-phosphate acyltransferase [Roseinatronobacter sp.]|nr:1-acyl-sn-glycerol-3-phosphate acyltransferase [Roseinatronobacter sp.]
MKWDSDSPPPCPIIRRADWPRVIGRGMVLVVLVFGGLIVKQALRLIERPVFGLRRPVTPYITQSVCRAALVVIGLRLHITGQPLQARGALVANHASWLDIFALNAAARMFFVAKADIAGWPGIGWLARATGTVFIRRNRRDAARQKLLFEARLRAGHRLLFFPEGTSSDGLQVLPFKSTLFEAFFAPELRDFMNIQPVSICYHVPQGQDARLYGWWGDMDFARHFLRVLAQPRQGRIDLVFHTPMQVSEWSDRKALAQACEDAVRAGCATPPA